MDAKVQAPDAASFAMWQADTESGLDPGPRADFEQAVQEIRFHVMAGGASGSEAVQAALLQSIDGKSVREVLRLGLGWALDRAEKERDDLKKALGYNSAAVMHHPAGDDRDTMAAAVQRQADRLAKAEAEVSRLRGRWAADGLGAPSPAP
jgi:hypothetical protein